MSRDEYLYHGYSSFTHALKLERKKNLISKPRQSRKYPSNSSEFRWVVVDTSFSAMVSANALFAFLPIYILEM